MKNLRGKKLDIQLKKELEDMIELGYKLAPISRSTLQRRLKLASRGTLSIPSRSLLIEEARKIQLDKEGLDLNKKKKRNTVIDQNKILKDRIKELESQRDNLIEKIAMIINGAQAKGYDVDELMKPIRNL
jgi:uncharacterized protein (UPF0335 family)